MKNFINTLAVAFIMTLVFIAFILPLLASKFHPKFIFNSPIYLAGSIRNGICYTNKEDYPKLGILTICTGHNLYTGK